MSKAPIGDVLVVPIDCDNPYTYQGRWSRGLSRALALRNFRIGVDTEGLQLWHAPADGGARRITADDVNWETM
jgi:hypothetical protein